MYPFPQPLQDNDILAMRMRNTFAPQNVSSPQLPNPSAQTTGQPTSGYDPVSRFNELYKPQSMMTNQYMQALQQMPQPQNPSNARKLGAFLVGLGSGTSPAGMWGGNPVGMRSNPQEAMNASATAANLPYIEQQAQFQQKMQPLAAGAQLEQQQNLAQRQYAEQVVRDELTNRLRDIEASNAQSRALHYQQMDSARNLIAKNPNYKPVIDDNDQLVLYNTKNADDVIYTGIDTNKLSDEEKANLNISGRLKAIAAQGAQSRQTVGARGEEERKTVGVRGEEARKTKATPGAAPAGSETTTETTVTDASGKPVGTKKTHVTKKPVTAQQLPPGFSIGQQVKGKDGRMGTLKGVNPDGTPNIEWKQ